MESPQNLNNDHILSFCPFCKSNKIRGIGPVKYFQMIFADTPISLQNIPYYARCSYCKSGFIQNAVQEKDANVLYSKKSSNRWSSPLPFNKRRTKNLVKLISKLLKPGIKILDIGCSTGQLLEFTNQYNCDFFLHTTILVFAIL